MQPAPLLSEIDSINWAKVFGSKAEECGERVPSSNGKYATDTKEGIGGRDPSIEGRCG
jgi:hypothetical protein